MNPFQQVHPSAAEYVFHEDDGHGWLAVPMVEVLKLGIAVTPFSYQSADGRTAYLEEDCDLSAFVRARAALNQPVRYAVQRTAGDSFVRSLPRFRAPTHAAPAAP